MRGYFSVLAAIVFFSSTLPSFGQQYAVLGHHLGESEEEAKTVALANGMTNFVCTDGGLFGDERQCTADEGSHVAKSRAITITFSDGKATTILYEFPGNDVQKLKRSLEKEYGAPHEGTEGASWTHEKTGKDQNTSYPVDRLRVGPGRVAGYLQIKLEGIEAPSATHLSVLPPVAVDKHAPPPVGIKYSVLGYHLGQSEEEARTVARANGMTEFTCKEIVPTARQCDAKASGAVNAGNTDTMSFKFLKNEACEIIYSFSGKDIPKLVHILDVQYGRHNASLDSKDEYFRSDGVAQWQPHPESSDNITYDDVVSGDNNNSVFDQLSVGNGEAKDTLYIKLKNTLRAKKFSNLASQDLWKSLTDAVSAAEGDVSKDKK
ncbi:MAG: hypothetical protein WCA21_15900 [Terracidiphilus sp.]